MTWRELPPLDTGVADELPPLDGISLVAGAIHDYTNSLWPEERAGIERFHEKRAREFSTGRHLARLAMTELGLPPGAVARAEDRRPLWPGGILGSITHAGELAVAAVARDGSVGGLGIDLELTGRVTDRLYSRVFTAAERARVEASTEPDLATVLFSAKEAGYKAVNPAVGRYIGFHEAEVDVCWPQRTLRLRYLGRPRAEPADGAGRRPLLFLRALRAHGVYHSATTLICCFL